MTYTELTTSVLVQTKEFETRYLQPYYEKQDRLQFEGKSDPKVDSHVKFLSEYTASIRSHVESQTLLMMTLQELDARLVEAGIKKSNGELKISIKAQAEALLPILKQITSTEI